MNKYYPKITIITPTLNSVEDIESCILSVAKQTHKNIEHLIIDGKSEDLTVSIVKKYAEIYLHIKYISEKDNGIYDAMNKGIEMSAGEWIYFLGSDDILYDNDILENLFKNKERIQFDVIYGNVIFKNSGEVYAGKFFASKLTEKCICHQAIFYKKKLFEKIGKFEIKYKSGADWVHNMKWFNDKKIRRNYINKVIAVYNENGYSSKNRDIEFEKDKEKIIRKYFSLPAVVLYKIKISAIFIFFEKAKRVWKRYGIIVFLKSVFMYIKYGRICFKSGWDRGIKANYFSGKD